MNETEYGWNKKQRRHGRAEQAADHGAAQGRVLLSAFAHAHRHRHHADNHRKRRHDDRTEAREPGFDGRLQRIAMVSIRSLANDTTRMLLAVATPMHMIEPISAGTLSRVA